MHEFHFHTAARVTEGLHISSPGNKKQEIGYTRLSTYSMQHREPENSPYSYQERTKHAVVLLSTTGECVIGSSVALQQR
jgi:hypothetical protein